MNAKKNEDPSRVSEGQGEVGSTEDAGQEEVQRTFDEANEKGYFGEVPDETPNENYTLKGVTSEAPTPETERGK